MDFGSALQHLRIGAQLRRTGWNGKGMFIFLVPGSKFTVNRPPLLGIYPEGTEVEYHAHVDMKTADGKIVPWLASQTDLLADDWEFVPGPYTQAPDDDDGFVDSGLSDAQVDRDAQHEHDHGGSGLGGHPHDD